MQGIPQPSSQKGIIPRAFDHIFETIQVSEGIKYLVHASYLEIYNEEIRDLLGKDVKQRLELKEHPERGVYVQSLSMHPCKNVADCERVMEKGWKNRSTGSTLMNDESSRSHSIFSIHLERCDKNSNGEDHIRAAKLNLVDLAGSERQAKSGATGDRLKEATKINLSLSALGNVISALVDGKSKHIPYRDSKLTRLLQDSLGGNTKTLMVACLSPADNNYDETLSTLRYANRAKNIKNKPKINEDPKDAMLREYQEEIERLKAMLKGDLSAQVEGKNSEPRVIEKVVHVSNKEEIEAEKKRIREEYEHEMKKLKEELSATKAGKEEIQQEMNSLRGDYEQQLTTLEKEFRQNSSDSAHIQSNGDAGDSNSSSQQAIHLATHKGKAAEKTKKTSSSDSGQSDAIKEASKSSRENDPKLAMHRLQELEQNMVGGEQASNEEVKEQRKKKKRYAEDRRKKLQEALTHMDGDEIMLGIYESVQDELRVKSKKLEKQKLQCDSLQHEILDLQSEFEYDRMDYLDTIRKQEQQMKWLQGVVDRIHPTLRRDCNYVNLDRIRAHSEWDEFNQVWVLPKISIEKSHLPPAGSANSATKSDNAATRSSDFSYNGYEDFRSEDRYIQKLNHSDQQELAKNYFKNSRAEELLNRTPNNESGSSARSPKYGRNGLPPPSTLEQDDMVIRKPTRLESLPSTSGKSGKKKK